VPQGFKHFCSSPCRFETLLHQLRICVVFILEMTHNQSRSIIAFLTYQVQVSLTFAFAWVAPSWLNPASEQRQGSGKQVKGSIQMLGDAQFVNALRKAETTVDVDVRSCHHLIQWRQLDDLHAVFSLSFTVQFGRQALRFLANLRGRCEYLPSCSSDA